MASCSRRSAARQYELLQRWQRIVESVENILQSVDMFGLDDVVSGNAELAAHVEQLVLYFCQTVRHFRGQTRYSKQYADRAVELIDCSVRFDALAVLRYTRTVSETCGPVV